MKLTYLKRVAIAQIIAAVVNAEGGIGPMSGEECTPNGDEFELESQMGVFPASVGEDGRIHQDEESLEERYSDMQNDMDYTDEEMEEEFGTVEDFVNENASKDIEEYMSPENGWFGADSKIEEKALELIKLIMKTKR